MIAKARSYEIDMTSGPLAGKILLFTVPLILSSMLQLLFNAADIIVVGQFASPNSVAAVGSTSSVINLIVALFMGLGVGVNVVVAHYYALRQEKDLSETVHTAAFIGIAGGGLLLAVGVLLARGILQAMGSPADVIDLSALYMRIYFLGMPANLFYNMGAAILRAVGDTRRPLYYLLIAGVFNVFLNLAFVILLHMDVAGVALATIISQLLSALLVARCLIQTSDIYRMRVNEIRLNRDKMARILRIGLPAGVQGTVFSISNVVIQSSVNSFGSAIMAGSAAAANIEGFVYVAMNSFYQACVSFTSQNAGVHKRDRIMRVLVVCIGMVSLTGILLGGFVNLLGKDLLSIYITPTTASPQAQALANAAIAAGIVRLSYISGPYFMCGVMDVLCGSLRGIGHSVAPMIISILGACVLRIVWIATIFQSMHTLQILYMAYPVSWTVTALVQFLLFYKVFIRPTKREAMA